MSPKKLCGAFTLVELVVVILIIAVISSVLISITGGHHVGGRESRNRAYLRIIEHALEAYRLDFSAYPPDNSPTSNGSEVLAHYLCRKLSSGTQVYGPYLNVGTLADADQNGFPEYLSPLKNIYTYKLIGQTNSRVLLIDPGPDRKIGGTIDPKKGFVPDNSGADKDNLYSIPPGE